jgi:subfamily B ATP-binding cassette protein MsbA
MNNFRKIIPFILPYKKYAYLNILFNVLYAFFGTLSFLALMPMMDVLFGQANKIYELPVYEGVFSLKKYLGDYLNYYLTMTTEQYGIGTTLSILVVGIISIFLLKNLCDYFAMFFITFLRNGILRDMRDAMYKKTIELPLAFFSEKRKGDTISRIAGDGERAADNSLYHCGHVFY